jgi:ribosome-associated heat shock protein Hsp15
MNETRLDRWLWAARFFKTRSLAAEAVDGGKVHVNGTRVKRSKTVTVGDELMISKPPFELTVIVEGLSEHRGPAAEAQRLYRETDASVAARERLRLQLKYQPTVAYEGKGRPTKKDRRALERLKRRR